MEALVGVWVTVLRRAVVYRVGWGALGPTGALSGLRCLVERFSTVGAPFLKAARAISLRLYFWSVKTFLKCAVWSGECVAIGSPARCVTGIADKTTRNAQFPVDSAHAKHYVDECQHEETPKMTQTDLLP